jgi:hypothetical protein
MSVTAANVSPALMGIHMSWMGVKVHLLLLSYAPPNMKYYENPLFVMKIP